MHLSYCKTRTDTLKVLRLPPYSLHYLCLWYVDLGGCKNYIVDFQIIFVKNLTF